MAGGLIVALDINDQDKACDLAREVGDKVAAVKVGSQLFSVAGPDIVNRIQGAGASVFLDLKFHDIPNTVRKAVEAVSNLGVSFFTVHASGGREMISAAKEAAGDSKVLAVTILTSLGPHEVSEIGFGGDIGEHVVRLAELAREAGADGIVCSPLEVARLRAVLDPACILVTPGVRPAGSAVNDQARIATPAQALKSGADYLVVGRPIVKAIDPVKAVEMILDEMEKNSA